MDMVSGFAITAETAYVLLSMAVALVAGIGIGASYLVASGGKRVSRTFVITAALIPVIMAALVPFIATDLKKTLSLAGVFALVRFRSIPGDAKDILYVFFSAAAGLIIGLNSYVLGLVLVLAVGLLFILMNHFWKSADKQVLKITIPEDMNYKDVFTDIFARHLVSYGVKNVKTSNMGTLFTIAWWIEPKKDFDAKAFIDEVRTRNGNLNVILENPDDQSGLAL